MFDMAFDGNHHKTQKFTNVRATCLSLEVLVVGGRGGGGEGGEEVVVVVGGGWGWWWWYGQLSTACVSLHTRRQRMHLIGWQNTWEQAPGVPATPSPP